MMILLTYDVDYSDSDGAKRLRKVAKLCQQYGVRVQNSVFEMLIDPAQLVMIKSSLNDIIDHNADSVRFYRLGNSWESKIETMGKDKGFSQTDPLIL